MTSHMTHYLYIPLILLHMHHMYADDHTHLSTVSEHDVSESLAAGHHCLHPLLRYGAVGEVYVLQFITASTAEETRWRVSKEEGRETEGGRKRK